MRAFLSALMKEGVISIVVLVLLCLLVWFGGEFLADEENNLIKERILIIAILIGIFLVLFVIQKMLAVRNAMRIEQQLKNQSGSQLSGADADKKAEIEALSKKFDESLEALKKTKGGKSALFTLPWYIIIGPPGSGKTTALQESGLNFPAIQGGAKVRGIGGTRNCDWWFTEDGILLDTAGRYTTVAEDQEEWFAFLDMIRTSRKDKPINGAIVAIAIDDLFRSSSSELDQIAKDVRNRLDELAARLQGVFPVYLMFTKCDLIQGFVEFYEDFTKEQRGQVWGFTMPYSLPDRQYTDIFVDEIGRMNRNISARQLELLATERPPVKKQNIYLFPRQFQLATEKMKELIGALFAANAFQESAMLRGVYFTSGTQKGTPIDQLLARMGETMGFGSVPEGSEERVEKKSYFIHNLFTKVIFHDRTLARSNSRVLRKRRNVRVSLSLLSLVALAMMSYALISSFVGNHSIISNVEAAGVAVRETEANDRIQLEKLEKLEVLRAELASLDNNRVNGRPLSLSFGMYQGNTMFDAGAKLYFDHLRPLHITPCQQRLERELRDLVSRVDRNSPAADYQRLLDVWRVYRMMGGKLEAQPALVDTILKRNERWTGPLMGSETERIESLAGEQLEFYAAQLARAYNEEDQFSLFVKIDALLDTHAAEKLQNGLWAANAYDSVIQHVSEKRPPVGLRELVPNNSDYLEFRNADSTNIRRLNAFSQEAWDSDVKPLLDESVNDLTKLYKELKLERSESEIRESLYQSYRNDHVRAWDDVLKQAYPKASLVQTINQSREVLDILRRPGAQSPFRQLVESAWKFRTIRLGVGNEVVPPSEEETKSLELAMQELDKFVSAFTTFANKGGAGQDRFWGYAPGANHPLDALLAAFNSVDQDLPKQFIERNNAAGFALMHAVEVAREALQREAKAEVESRWDGTPVKTWKQSLEGRFPLAPQASSEASMANFSRMFNPKGIFWNTERNARALASVTFPGTLPLISLSVEFEQTVDSARAITDAMFDTENDQLVKVRFGVKLIQEGLLVRSRIEIGSDEQGKLHKLDFNENPAQTKDFVWQYFDNQQSRMGARVTAWYMSPARELPSKNRLDSEWGLLRLVWNDRARFEAKMESGRKVYQADWQFRSPQAEIFELSAEFRPVKDNNPFDKDLFTRFSMPENVTP